MALLIDKDPTFDKIWKVLVDTNVLSGDELLYLDSLHQKALSLDALTDSVKGE